MARPRRMSIATMGDVNDGITGPSGHLGSRRASGVGFSTFTPASNKKHPDPFNFLALRDPLMLTVYTPREDAAAARRRKWSLVHPPPSATGYQRGGSGNLQRRDSLAAPHSKSLRRRDTIAMINPEAGRRRSSVISARGAVDDSVISETSRRPSRGSNIDAVLGERLSFAMNSSDNADDRSVSNQEPGKLNLTQCAQKWQAKIGKSKVNGRKTGLSGMMSAVIAGKQWKKRATNSLPSPFKKQDGQGNVDDTDSNKPNISDPHSSGDLERKHEPRPTSLEDDNKMLSHSEDDHNFRIRSVNNENLLKDNVCLNIDNNTVNKETITSARTLENQTQRLNIRNDVNQDEWSFIQPSSQISPSRQPNSARTQLSSVTEASVEEIETNSASSDSSSEHAQKINLFSRQCSTSESLPSKQIQTEQPWIGKSHAHKGPIDIDEINAGMTPVKQRETQQPCCSCNNELKSSNVLSRGAHNTKLTGVNLSDQGKIYRNPAHSTPQQRYRLQPRNPESTGYPSSSLTSYNNSPCRQNNFPSQNGAQTWNNHLPQSGPNKSSTKLAPPALVEKSVGKLRRMSTISLIGDITGIGKPKKPLPTSYPGMSEPVTITNGFSNGRPTKLERYSSYTDPAQHSDDQQIDLPITRFRRTERRVRSLRFAGRTRPGCQCDSGQNGGRNRSYDGLNGRRHRYYERRHCCYNDQDRESIGSIEDIDSGVEAGNTKFQEFNHNGTPEHFSGLENGRTQNRWTNCEEHSRIAFLAALLHIGMVDANRPPVSELIEDYV